MSVEVTETGLNLIPAGYKQTEVGVIPEDWDIRNIGDFAPLQRGFDLPSANRVNGKYPVVYSNGIVNTHCHFKVKGPGVVTGRSGTLGKVHYVEADYWPHNTSLWVTKFNETNPKFIYFIFTYINFERFASGSGVPTLNRNDAHSFKIAIPSSQQEQTAIANALSDVDTLISKLENLIAKKQAIKTATMQQLLTGRTRLPQFALREDGSKKGTKQSILGEIPEDWEVDSIGNLISITTGSRNTQDRIEEGVYPFFVRSQTVERINTFSFDGEAVLTAGDGVGTGKVFHYINGKFDFHQRVYLMYNFGEIIDGYFFYIYFSNNFYDRIMSMTAKSSVDSVRREMIADMKMLLPTKKEQTAIATILSDMDKEIQVLEQRLNKTRKIKQGMMQELLTGKTRLVQPSPTDICHVD
ncbi:TPA: restriction endonuclease subunit S [Proteus mirabilis]|nr:restriction endonuclease subunit S [Proteus mirabilis]